MAELIDITFEEVQLDKLAEVLIKILSGSVLRDCAFATETPEIELDFQSSAMLYNSIDQSFDGAFLLFFLEFKLSELELSNVGIQIHKYESNYELAMDVEKKEVTRRISLSDFHRWAESVAEGLSAKSFYCGLEPARDEDTRFFTGKALGPLNGW